MMRCLMACYLLLLIQAKLPAQGNANAVSPNSVGQSASTLSMDERLQARRPARDALGQEMIGENEGEIETDRDSFTPAITTVRRAKTILESAYTFSDNRHFKEGHSFPELLVRYGLTERLELRLGWNYEVTGVEEHGEMAEPGILERQSRLSYGIKYRLTEAECWMPGSAVILQGSSPTSRPNTDTQFVATYVFGWDLPQHLKFDASFRYLSISEEEDHFNEWAPSVVLKIPIGEKINTHVEYFGLFSSGRAVEFTRHYVSPGVHYLVTENLEIGVRAGWGLNNQSDRFFINAGLGWQF